VGKQKLASRLFPQIRRGSPIGKINIDGNGKYERETPRASESNKTSEISLEKNNFKSLLLSVAKVNRDGAQLTRPLRNETYNAQCASIHSTDRITVSFLHELHEIWQTVRSNSRCSDNTRLHTSVTHADLSLSISGIDDSADSKIPIR
jgi:hypothetical protein